MPTRPLKFELSDRDLLKRCITAIPPATEISISAGQLARLLDELDGAALSVHPQRDSSEDPTVRGRFLTARQLVERDDSGWVTVDEAAQYLGIKKAAVCNAIKRRDLIARRVGKRFLLVDATSVRTYNSRVRKSSSPAAPSEVSLQNGGAEPASRDPIRLAQRIATLISYEKSKKEIVDDLLKEGFSNEEIFFSYAAAQVMLKSQRMQIEDTDEIEAAACGYCGSTAGFERGPEGWDVCRSCGGI